MGIRIPTFVLATLLVVPFAVVLEHTTNAAEIDSVTERGLELRDSARPLNRWLDARIRSGIHRANERSEGCDEDVLYAEVRRAIASPFIGHVVAEELNDMEQLDSRRVLFDESIYRDLGLFDAISVHWKDLSAVVRVGDHLIGVDKLGHLLVEGWGYFEIAYLDEEGIESALDWGERTERTYFGHYTTGVYSNADLATNFEGMRLWLRMLGRQEDPLRETGLFDRPNIKCSRKLFFGRKRWKVARKIDVERHLTGASDELVNCSSYRNPEIQAAIEGRIRAREIEDRASYSCPIDPASCVDARERYGEWAPRLLHPRCLNAEAPHRPWWRFW